MAVIVLVAGDVELVVARLAGERPDLALVDTLARLQLSARRLGWSIRLCGPDAWLCELLDLVGLADVVRVAGSPLQAGRETEGGEQLGVEEVLDGGDPSA